MSKFKSFSFESGFKCTEDVTTCTNLDCPFHKDEREALENIFNLELD